MNYCRIDFPVTQKIHRQYTHGRDVEQLKKLIRSLSLRMSRCILPGSSNNFLSNSKCVNAHEAPFHVQMVCGPKSYRLLLYLPGTQVSITQTATHQEGTNNQGNESIIKTDGSLVWAFGLILLATLICCRLFESQLT
uniref:Uncharacterized protein n=1 Tax=Schistocephalus solidus TaxID=70667 RepID=A0A0X3NFC5_SCHSO